MKELLMGIKTQRRLKPDALPTIGCVLKADDLFGNNDAGDFDGNNEGINNVQDNDETDNLGNDFDEDEDNLGNDLDEDNDEECVVEGCDRPEKPLFPVPDDVNRLMAWFDAHKKWKGGSGHYFDKSHC